MAQSKSAGSTKTSIKKVSNVGMTGTKVGLGELPSTFGYAGLRGIQDYVAQTLVKDLRWPNNLLTFDKMVNYDHSVQLGMIITQILVEKSFTNPVIRFNKESPKSRKAAEFVKWNLKNLENGFLDAIRNAYSSKVYGFSVLVKIWDEIKTGKYAGKYKYRIKKLSPRSQKTLNKTDPFLIGQDGQVMYCRQDTQTLTSTFAAYNYRNIAEFKGKSYIDIPREKFMLFSYDSTNNNPLGRSVLTCAYKPWKEKLMLEDYQMVGVSKDMNGTPILYAPSEILDRAASDPSSSEAKSMEKLMMDLANMHAGEQSFMLLPSDLTEGSTTKQAFEVRLIGVEGGSGKAFDTVQLITERHKAILNCFGAAFIILGQDQVGSYALSDTQKGIHGFFVERDVNFLCEVFNRDLIPQLLALNDIFLEDEDMPLLVPGSIDEGDKDVASKAIQRAGAVGFLTMHPEVLNEALQQLGFIYRIPEDIVNNPDKWLEYKSLYLPKSTSRSGDGLEEGMPSGTGDSLVGNSDINSDNAA